MLITKPLSFLMDHRMAFFQEFLKHPLHMGSIIPSSRFLERQVVEAGGVPSARTIVELGPGTGGTTRAILRAMKRDARLLSIEINRHLHALVSGIRDDRLVVHLGSARALVDTLSLYGMGVPDVLISGIPFSTMSHGAGTEILEEVFSVLAPGGRFVAYQLSKRVCTLCRPLVGPGRMEVQLFNIPPQRIYCWQKNCRRDNVRV
jgi:phosphatidylethanolamine/phosphatidyl-N-methylethanolamine N-methyltransferase